MNACRWALHLTLSLNVSVSLTLCLALFVCPLPAEAKVPDGLVAIITDRNTNSIVLRLNAELETFGFRSLIFATGVKRPRGPQILAMAHSVKGVAAISLFANEGAAEIWIIRPSGELVDHEKVRSARGETDAFFALRVIDAMRARFLDLRPATAPAAPEEISLSPARGSAPAVITSDGDHALHYKLGGGGGVGWSPGGLSSAGFFRLSAGLLPRRWLETGLHLSLPLTTAEGIDAKDATFDAHLVQVALELRLLLRRRHTPLSPFIGAGAQVTFILAPDDDAVAVAPYLALGLLVRLSDRWCIFSAVRLGVSVNDVAIMSGSVKVASWGRPLVSGALGVSVEFF